MTVQIGIVLLTFVIFVVLILSNKVKIDLAAMAIPIILEVTQILDFGEAWSGLVNNSVIMMASMFVVGAAVGQDLPAWQDDRRADQARGLRPENHDRDCDSDLVPGQLR